MIGKLFGRLLAAPVRLANVPIKAFAELATGDPQSGRAENTLDRIADNVERAARKVIDG